MLNIGPLELLLIFLIALIVVGPKKLPDLGKTIGQGLREFRKAQAEVRQNLQLDELKDMKREITDTQRGVRDALRFETPKTGAAPRGSSPVVPPVAGPTSAPQKTPDADVASGTDGPAAAEPAGDEPRRPSELDPDQGTE
jgi:Tat protein translocase TatB subunit